MISETGLSDISFVVPVWNEAAYLPRLLDTVNVGLNRYRHGPERIEVIVADNGPTDETPKIAMTRGCHVEHVPKRLSARHRLKDLCSTLLVRGPDVNVSGNARQQGPGLAEDHLG